MATERSKRALWQCPECRHRFVTKDLWHSCGRYRLVDHFAGKPPLLRSTFNRLVGVARDCGPVTVYAQKTRIVLQGRVRFAGAVVRRTHLDAGLWLKRRARHPLLTRVESFGRLGYGLHFRLERPADIDAAFSALMQEAYRTGQQVSPSVRAGARRAVAAASPTLSPTRGRIIADMATSSKRSSASQGKRAARPSSDTPRLSSEPFLRFYYAAGLRKKTLSVLSTLERAQDATAHRGALADVVVELTRSGMDSYFMKPLKQAKAGFIVQQSASLGLAGAMQMIGSVIRNIIGRMDQPQLLSVCGSIRQFMR